VTSRIEDGGRIHSLASATSPKTTPPRKPSLGTNFTLISPYTMLSHFKELERIEKYGVLSHQLRASIGIESKDVIIGKFERALKLAA
jgi:cystathionine beta-lyase/cystathionine gamma-synthase